MCDTCTDLPTCPYLTVLVRKMAGSTDVCPYFSKYQGFLTGVVHLYYISCLRYTILAGNPRYGHRNSREYKPIVERLWSYCSMTLAYFKPFPGLMYTASPDWSKKFLISEHRFCIGSVMEVSHLPMWQVLI